MLLLQGLLDIGMIKKMDTKLYAIPVTYQVWGVIDVEANSLEEACEYCLTKSPLPQHPEYLDDSIEIDKESLYLFNPTHDTTDN